MFKYTEAFYNDKKFIQESALEFNWYSRSAQLNRAHLFSSIEHDRVTQYFEWNAKYIPVNVADEVVSRVLKNITSAGIRSVV